MMYWWRRGLGCSPFTYRRRGEEEEEEEEEEGPVG